MGGNCELPFLTQLKTTAAELYRVTRAVVHLASGKARSTKAMECNGMALSSFFSVFALMPQNKLTVCSESYWFSHSLLIRATLNIGRPSFVWCFSFTCIVHWCFNYQYYVFPLYGFTVGADALLEVVFNSIPTSLTSVIFLYRRVILLQAALLTAVHRKLCYSELVCQQ